MKNRMGGLICFVLCSICLAAGCAQEDLLSKMRNLVPIFEGAKVTESYMPTEKMAVIRMEVEVAKSSQKELLDFYKDTMTKKDWELTKLKDYGKNGSVMVLTNNEFGTLS
ncbi:MAG: hypothetical protein HKO91_07655, partial [Desulfobacterales bacterium]|nr:hypothetical protein [Desulfobacterales bacterium]